MRYRQVAQDLVDLEDRTVAMWQELHPSKRKPDEIQLRGEIEAKSRSERATKEDKGRLELLENIREKRAILLNLHKHVSSYVLQSKELPGEKSPMQVRRAFSCINQRIEMIKAASGWFPFLGSHCRHQPL